MATTVKLITSPGGRVNWHTGSGKIAYDRRNTGFADSRKNGWFNIYTANEDGTGEVSLTKGVDFGWAAVMNDGGVHFRHVGLPVWKPDGTKIAFWVERIDLSSAASVIDNVTYHNSAEPGRGAFNDLWIMNANGSGKQLLWSYTSNGGMHAYWNPAMNKMAWSHLIPGSGGDYGNWEIKIADYTEPASVPTVSSINTYNPASSNGQLAATMNEINHWKPDGTQIAMSGNPINGQPQHLDDVFTIDPTTGLMLARKTKSSGVGGEAGNYDEHLVWSADGTKMAWMTTKDSGTGSTDLWIMNDDGTNQQRLSYFNQPGSSMFVPPVPPATKCAVARPSWSADGLKIMVSVYDHDNTDGANAGQGPIYLLDFSNAGGGGGGGIGTGTRNIVDRNQVARNQVVRHQVGRIKIVI